MARILALVPDLLFGSQVVGALTAAGHDVELLSEPSDERAKDFDLVIVDLTADGIERIENARPLLTSGPRALAFYAHVETEVKDSAIAAGFDLVVPRSRMARAAPELAGRLLAPDE